MCTAFVHKGDDLIVGFDFDLDPAMFTYGVYKRKDKFFIGITVGSTTYRTHGVNRNGNAGNLPYMNGSTDWPRRRGEAYRRLDVLNDRYIAGKSTYAELLQDVRTKTVVNLPGMSMHSQFTDADGHILIVEPGVGYREVDAPYSIVTNYPVLDVPADLSSPFYGADRYQTGLSRLQGATDAFSVDDGLRLLEAVKQGGQWATRVSFLYSQNDNAVYYTLDGDFSRVFEHRFA